MNEMRVNAILLAAGLGERLYPLTKEWPKCLMPVDGIPILELWISDLIKVGINDIFINTHHLAEEVEKFLSRKRFSNKIKIVRENQLLGTAGTIKFLSKKLLKLPTLVIHADNFCGMDLKEFINMHQNHRPAGCEFSMMTFDTDTPESCGIVKLDENSIVSEFYEKQKKLVGNYANGAVYLLEPSVIEWLMEKDIADFSTEVIPEFIGKIFAIKNNSFHVDIGSFEGLKNAQLFPRKELIWRDKDKWLHNFSSNPIHNSIGNLRNMKNE